MKTETRIKDVLRHFKYDYERAEDWLVKNYKEKPTGDILEDLEYLTRGKGWWKPENSTDLDLTECQEDALEHAILSIFRNNSHGAGYRIRELKLECSGHKVHLMIVVDNGLPGTIGHTFPTYATLFIGPRGGYSTYTRKGRKVSGWRALIECRN